MSATVENSSSSEAKVSDYVSPIKIFGYAKTEIGDIFSDMSGYIGDSIGLLNGTEWKNIALPHHIELVQGYSIKVSGILEMICRNCMKVAFFGRTSNGKSTVVNAMLKSKLLPSGIGHTTNCFVQVEGTDLPDAFIVTDDAPDVKQNIQSVSHLAHALSGLRLESDSLIRICWPSDRCRLLKEDVVFVDSPGIDVSPDMDQWIDKFCLDADVFVLVANAESTLMQTEKNFFHRVAARLSKPNIFILNNRWDASASEPETVAEVRQQHIDRGVSFLSTELCVMSPEEAAQHIFFVSARETLDQCDMANRSPGRAPRDGWQARVHEFANFECKFEECISQSALVTKFAHHVSNAGVIVCDLRRQWTELHATSQRYRDKCYVQLRELCLRVKSIDSQQKTLMSNIDDDIYVAVKDVYDKMFTVLNDEICRLSRVLEEFDRPFDADPATLRLYKKELHFHVEECLSRNLHIRCSGFVHNVLRTCVQHMNETVRELLASAAESFHNPDVSNVSDFSMSYHLDCSSLLSGFHEDLQFHFSLGITSLMRRFLGPCRPCYLTKHISVPRGVSSKQLLCESDSIESVLSAFTSIYSGTTVGSLAVVAFVTRSLGWKIIMACAATYCLLYVYERVTWTAKAKHETFRRQYISYAMSQLGMVAGIVTEYCSSQVERELQSSRDLLEHQVNSLKGEMQEKVEKLNADAVCLDVVVSKAEQMRSRVTAIESKLSAFTHKFLGPVI